MELGLSTLKTSQNKKLQKSLDTIVKLSADSTRALEKIAVKLAEIDRLRFFESEGYKNTAEMVKDYLGYSKQTTSVMIRVGNRFFLQDGTPNLTVEGQQFSLYQLQEMLPLYPDELDAHVGTDITPGMSAKEIRKAVKKIQGKGEPEKVEQKESKDDESSEVPSTEYVGLETLFNCMCSLEQLVDEHPLEYDWIKELAHVMATTGKELIKKYKRDHNIV